MLQLQSGLSTYLFWLQFRSDPGKMNVVPVFDYVYGFLQDLEDTPKSTFCCFFHESSSCFVPGFHDAFGACDCIHARVHSHILTIHSVVDNHHLYQMHRSLFLKMSRGNRRRIQHRPNEDPLFDLMAMFRYATAEDIKSVLAALEPFSLECLAFWVGLWHSASVAVKKT